MQSFRSLHFCPSLFHHTDFLWTFAHSNLLHFCSWFLSGIISLHFGNSEINKCSQKYSKKLPAKINNQRRRGRRRAHYRMWPNKEAEMQQKVVEKWREISGKYHCKFEQKQCRKINWSSGKIMEQCWQKEIVQHPVCISTYLK